MLTVGACQAASDAHVHFPSEAFPAVRLRPAQGPQVADGEAGNSPLVLTGKIAQCWELNWAFLSLYAALILRFDLGTAQNVHVIAGRTR